MNQLESIKTFTTIVADTGDIQSIQAYQPQDATTNPSLIYQASQQAEYQDIVAKAVNDYQNHSSKNLLENVLDELSVSFGSEILKLIPGRVSTEVDARLSFDTLGSYEKALKIIDMYASRGIDKDRILIKLASTWEGIEACRLLEKEGIHCNMTLLFDISQAVACAEVGATLISPFVGRILDWYKLSEGRDSYLPHEDPGVVSVTNIYNYFKKFDYKTVVMGASFRNKDEILQLAGCDLLTISPKLLQELKDSVDPIQHKLNPLNSKQLSIEPIQIDEKTFRWLMNDNAMATEKLSEGIRKFTVDLEKLEKFINEKYL